MSDTPVLRLLIFMLGVAVSGCGPSPQPKTPQKDAAFAEALRRLDEPIPVNPSSKSVEELCSHVSRLTGVGLIAKWGGKADWRIFGGEQKKVPAWKLLDFLCQKTGLAWTVADRIHIGPKEYIDSIQKKFPERTKLFQAYLQERIKTPNERDSCFPGAIALPPTQ